MEWNFSRALHLRETIRSLADAAEENLKTLLSKAHPHEMNSLAVNRRMLERFRTSGTRGR
jgi:hypothetical protein